MYAYITHITTTTIKIKDFSKLKVPLSPLLSNAIPLMHLHHLQNPLHGSKQALIWFLSLQISLYQNSFKWNHTVGTKVCLTSVLLCFFFSAWFWNLFILLHVSLVYFFFCWWVVFLYMYMLLCCLCMLSHAQLFVTYWTEIQNPPLSVGFSRQEYWSELPFPTLGDLPNPGITPYLLYLLHWQADSHLTIWEDPVYIYTPLFIYEFIHWHAFVD